MEDELKAGVVFAFNIDLVDPYWRSGETGCFFAETIVATETKRKRLYAFPINFQIINI
jgi:Xaa-Pro dipeptidase